MICKQQSNFMAKNFDQLSWPKYQFRGKTPPSNFDMFEYRLLTLLYLIFSKIGSFTSNFYNWLNFWPIFDGFLAKNSSKNGLTHIFLIKKCSLFREWTRQNLLKNMHFYGSYGNLYYATHKLVAKMDP